MSQEPTAKKKDARRQAAYSEIMEHFPGLMHSRTRLRSAGVEPTGVLLPARLDVPHDNPDATDIRATCMGLPVTWAEGDEWGLIVHNLRPIPPAKDSRVCSKYDGWEPWEDATWD